MEAELQKIATFSKETVQEAAKELGIPVLGQVPLDPKMAQAADEGEFYQTEHPYLQKAVEVLSSMIR